MKRIAQHRPTFLLVGLILLTVLIVLALSSCDELTASSTAHTSSFENVYCYYYEQLNSTEKELYNSLLATMERGSGMAEFDATRKSELVDAADRVLEALNYDHSEHFAYSGGLSYYEYGDSVYFEMDKWSYWQYSSAYDAQKKALNDIVEDIANTANREYKTNYEKAQFVHDYLIQHAAYDYNALEDVTNHPTSFNPSNEPVFTAYGCLINGRCVCAGYAHAYKLILDYLDIPCVYVTGWGDPTYRDAGHAWNRIILDDQSYYVDVTWDDNQWELYDDYGRQKYPNAASHNYFSITTDELLKTHSIDESSFAQPACVSEKYNYYNYYGLVIDTYSLDSVIDVVNKQKNNNPVSIKFNKASDLELAIEELYQQDGILKAPWLASYESYYNKEDAFMYWVF